MKLFFLISAFLLNVCFCFAQQPNIILITIDTLRADHLGCYGYKQDTSPNIDRLASRGLIFRNAFATAPITLPSHASILTGLYPAHHGFHDNAFFQTPSVWRLPEALKNAGYKTAAFISGAPLLSKYGINHGFDLYQDQIDGTERKAAETADIALKWIAKTSHPYFAWIHFFDPHAEYDPPREFASRFPGKPYDGEIAYVDQQIGKLIKGVDQNVLWIITADHGESLGEHGESTHGVFLYNATLHVPLIFAGPNITKQERAEAVSLSDIAPSIMAFANLKIPSKLDGVSLLNSSADRTLIAESRYAARNFGFAELYTSIQNDKKYISAPQPELYDLKNDFGETKNLIQNSDVAAFKKSVKDYQTNTIPTREKKLSPEDQEKLRSLGYVSSKTTVHKQIDPKTRIGWIEEFNKAMALLKLQKLDAAETAFRKLNREEPDSALSAKFLANTLAAKKQYAEAEKFYLSSFKIQPDPEVAVQLAKTYAHLNRMEDAESKLKYTVREFPDFAEAGFELASFYAEKGRYDEALTLLNTDSPEAHNQRGIIFLAKHDYEKAAAEFKEASKRSDNAQFSNNLGVAYRQQKRLQDAEAAFRHALELQPSYEEAEVNLCFTLMFMKRWDEARTRLERLTSKNFRLFGARLALGSVYENTAQYDLALTEYKKLADDVPMNWPQKAQLEMKIKELEKQ
jgi:tetratricopeptide (TPR) repeat protein